MQHIAPGEHWDTTQEHLRQTRRHFINADYLEFLLERVWKITGPVDVLDVGCGYGYLGLKLMPLLPAGSTYTGVDYAGRQIDEAQIIFEGSPYTAHFIRQNPAEYTPERQYGFVVGKAVLRHNADPLAVLQMMVDAARPGSVVACFEVNRRMENAGTFIEDYLVDFSERDKRLHSMWERELMQGSRDYLLGSRVPVYLEEMGLQNVGVRVNDCVEYISPLQEDYEAQMDIFARGTGLELPHAENRHTDPHIVHARSLLISYGTKVFSL